MDVYKDLEKVRILASFSEGAEFLRLVIIKINDKYYYPVGNNSINDISLEGDFDLYFGIYNGSNNLDLLKVFSGSFSGGKLLDTVVVSKQENINEFAFDIYYNDGIKSVEFRDYYIELKEGKKDFSVMIYVIFSIVICLIIVFLRRIIMSSFFISFIL